jgi:uncharacterized OB-fold protein
MTGTIYTETTIFSPPEAYLNDAPYQLVLVDKDGGGRVTARILGEQVRIGDRVELVELRADVPYFRKA